MSTSINETIQHIGSCRFCGQMRTIEYDPDELLDRIRETGKNAADIADEDATNLCNCPGADELRTRETSLESCEEIIEEMFRESYPEVADLLQEAKGIVYGGKVIKKVQITLPEGEGIATISYGRKGLNVDFKKMFHTSASTGF